MKSLFLHKSDKYSILPPAGCSVIQFFVFNSLIHEEVICVYNVKYESNWLGSSNCYPVIPI